MPSDRIRDSIGPSIIIAASVVGSGELIVAPTLGAQVGVSALWIILLGCMIKVFMQEEIGRHTILTGQTGLEAFNSVPGPRWRLSWVAWTWLLMLVSTAFQLAGMLVALVQAMHLIRIPGPLILLATLIAVATAAILIAGRYSMIEKLASILVAGFTFMTVVALALLHRTEFSLSFDQVLQGLKFQMPERGFAAAVTVFGITGIGTMELLYYPYWCLEKGYAADLHLGARRDLDKLRRRVIGMRIDIVAALCVYTFATTAFFLLGATVLHGQQQIPRGVALVESLSRMYTAVLGEWVLYVFAAGAICVLYSTFFVGLATIARMVADTIRLGTGAAKDFKVRKTTNVAIAVLALIYLLLCLAFSSTPEWMVIYGGAVQTFTLPVFGWGLVALRKQRVDPFRPKPWFDAALYLSLIIVTAVAVYSLVGTGLDLRKKMKEQPPEKVAASDF